MLAFPAAYTVTCVRRFLGTVCLMAASAVFTVVVLGLTGWLPATRTGAAPQLDCPMLQQVSVPAAELPAYPPQPSNRPIAVIVREVLDAESKRVNPQPPVGAGQIWPAVEAQTNPAVSRNGPVWYVSLINPQTGKTTAGLVFTDRASGLVLESLAYCADIRYWPTGAAPARQGRSPVSASVDGAADAGRRDDGARVYPMAQRRGARAACACYGNHSLQGRA